MFSTVYFASIHDPNIFKRAVSVVLVFLHLKFET